MRGASRQSDSIQYEGGGKTASLYDTILGIYEKGGGLKGSEDRYPRGKGKSKAYPMVSKGNFAGGSRSYPIPTRADAVDALRLAGLHGRSDVKSKVYAKYPDLKKQDGGRMAKADYEVAKERYFNSLTQEGKNYPIDRAQHRKDHTVLQENMRYHEPGGWWTTMPLKDAAYQTGNTVRSWFNQVANTHYEDGGVIRRNAVYTRNLNGPGGFKPPTSDYANPSQGGGTEAAKNTASRETGGRNMTLQTSKKCRGGLLYKCRGGRFKR